MTTSEVSDADNAVSLASALEDMITIMTDQSERVGAADEQTVKYWVRLMRYALKRAGYNGGMNDHS